MKSILSFTILLTFLWSTPSFCQTFLSGKVTDEDTGEELIFASVTILKDGVIYTKGNTDFDGNYKIEIDPDEYDVVFSYIGYSNRKILGIKIKKEGNFKLDQQLRTNDSSIICCPGVISYRIPLIEQDVATPGIKIVRDRIRDQPGKKISSLILRTPGVTTLRF